MGAPQADSVRHTSGLPIEAVLCALCGADEPRVVMGVDELSLRARSRIRWRIVGCRQCGLVYVNPRAPAGPAADYAGESYGFARSRMADLCVDGRPHSVRVLDALGGSPPGVLLDVGCATGEFLLEARRRGWSGVGAELSPYAVACARRRGLEVVAGTLAEARFPDGSFDAVTLLDVIEHLENPLAELREIRRVLRTGGRLVVETPNWRSIYRRLLRGRWAALQPRVHLLYFDALTLGRLLHAAGFRTVSARTEIVALFSPEAARRGLWLRWVSGVARDQVVRWRLKRPLGRIDDYLLRLGPAARVKPGAGSFKQIAQTQVEPGAGPPEVQGRALAILLRTLNWPTDRLFLRLGMGEQLRMVAEAC